MWQEAIGIWINLDFNPQKNISLLADGRRFFVDFFNMAVVTSCEHTLQHILLENEWTCVLQFNENTENAV